MLILRKTSGFTLIEISIVLMVVGLIVGGIIIGRDLIRSSELQSTINDLGRFQKATELFKEKYSYLPGDIPNAETFWGSDTNCPNTGYNVWSTSPRVVTCNGDGDGWVGLTYGSSHYEQHRFWQHLANAGMIDGTYTGVQGPGGDEQTLCGNAFASAPSSKLDGACYHAFSVRPQETFAAVGSDHSAYLPSGLLMSLGNNYGPISFSAPEAFALDQKYDDGNPLTGWITIQARRDLLCAGNNAGQYNANPNDNNCNLIFLIRP